MKIHPKVIGRVTETYILHTQIIERLTSSICYVGIMSLPKTYLGEYQNMMLT